MVGNDELALSRTIEMRLEPMSRCTKLDSLQISVGISEMKLKVRLPVSISCWLHCGCVRNFGDARMEQIHFLIDIFEAHAAERYT